jgi:hypothetical protein
VAAIRSRKAAVMRNLNRQRLLRRYLLLEQGRPLSLDR